MSGHLLIARFAALAAVLLAAPAAAVIDLPGSWRSRLGDDLRWALPDYDDAAWQVVALPGTWQEQGYSGVDGVIWYRHGIALDSAARSLLEAGDLALIVGFARFAGYEVYAGGHLVGSWGWSLPLPQPRAEVFRIPSGSVGDDGILVLALRARRVGWASDRASGGSPVGSTLALGSYDDLRDRVELQRSRDLIADLPLLLLSALFLAAAAYHLFLCLGRRQQSQYLWFGLLALSFSANTFLISFWPYQVTSRFDVVIRGSAFTGHAAALLAIQFLWQLLRVPISRPWRAYQASHGAMALFVVAWPATSLVFDTNGARFFWLLPLLVGSVVLILRQAWRGNAEARTLLVGALVLVAVESYELAVEVLGLPRSPLPLPPIGFAAVLVSMAFSLSRQFRRIYDELDEMRLGLERRVEEGTLALRQAETEAQTAGEARSEAENQLRHAQKVEAVGRLAGGVAHDFNNLLTVINGYAEMAMLRIGPKDPLRPDLEEIKKAGERAAALTRQLLAYSRRQVLRPKLLELNAAIANTESMLRRVIGEDVELLTRLAPELGRVRIDPGQLEQVVVNLAVNARDAMPRGGELILATRGVDLESELRIGRAAVPPGRYVLLEVEDSGEGMEEAVLENVFEPFFTTKPQGAGTGLGLSTVYGIVKQSGGFIFAESTLGRGSRFTVYLPRIDLGPAAEAGEVETPGAQHRGAGVILLVEDQDPVREVGRRILQDAGYQVLTAVDAHQARQVAADVAGEIDLLVTDVVLPGIGGPELADLLTADSKVARVLFISGYAEEAIARHGFEGRGDLLLKPFGAEELTRKVMDILS